MLGETKINESESESESVTFEYSRTDHISVFFNNLYIKAH